MTEQDINKALKINCPEDEFIVMSRKSPHDGETTSMIVVWNGIDVAELFEKQEAMNHGTVEVPDPLPEGLYEEDGVIKIDYAKYGCPTPEQLEQWVAELPPEPEPEPEPEPTKAELMAQMQAIMDKINKLEDE